MDLYPSIDLRGGQVVRLARGDYDLQTIYDDDPVAVARRFDAAGARWIHVVDLDAALAGGNPNLSMIEAICANVGCTRADRRGRTHGRGCGRALRGRAWRGSSSAARPSSTPRSSSS